MSTSSPPTPTWLSPDTCCVWPPAEPSRPRTCRWIIFFRSLALECKDRAVGVILSGTGSDGALGLAQIKASRGITFAQDEESAEYSAMPLNAVAGGVADFVLPPEQIARELAHIGQHPYLHLATTCQGEADADAAFENIVGRLRLTTGMDFSEYRSTTIKRRIARRMTLHQQESVAFTNAGSCWGLRASLPVSSATRFRNTLFSSRSARFWSSRTAIL